jgi:hypothetical protein
MLLYINGFYDKRKDVMYPPRIAPYETTAYTAPGTSRNLHGRLSCFGKACSPVSSCPRFNNCRHMGHRELGVGRQDE